MRISTASSLIRALVLLPIAGFAAPSAPPPATNAAELTLVQSWSDQGRRQDDPRDRASEDRLHRDQRDREQYQGPGEERYQERSRGAYNEASAEWQQRQRHLNGRARGEYGQIERQVQSLAHQQERTSDSRQRVSIEDQIHQLRGQQAGLLGLSYRP